MLFEVRCGSCCAVQNVPEASVDMWKCCECEAWNGTPPELSFDCMKGNHYFTDTGNGTFCRDCGKEYVPSLVEIREHLRWWNRY